MVQPPEPDTDDAPCGIFSIRDDGTLVSANRYLAGLLGYGESGLVGMNINRFMGTAARVFYGTHLYPMLTMHGHAEEIFLKFRSENGKDVPVMINAKVTFPNGEKLLMFACMAVPNRGAYEAEILAAKKKAEQKLEQDKIVSELKEREKKQDELIDSRASLVGQLYDELSRLSTVISHDLQEPLRKLGFYTGELQKKQKTEETRDRYLATVQKSAGQIRHRLLQLQAYLGISRDAPLDEQVDLSSVAKEQMAILGHSFPDTVLDLSMEELPVVSGNAAQLAIMFHELLKNAFVHGAVEQRLRLVINADVFKENAYRSLPGRYLYRDHVRITVSDCGPGFDPQHSGQIFEILNKMDGNSASLGVGLSICKRIVDVHKGRIWTAASPGKGASFFVALPLG